MTLVLTPAHLQALQADAEQAYPNEGCGLLLGHFNSATHTHALVAVKLLQNAWHPTLAEAGTALPEGHNFTSQPLTQARRYWIDPQDMLTAQKAARDQGLSIIGVYHSHPDHPAEPSECDRKLAWSDYAYIIVSVHQGHAVDLQCWQLDSQNQFQAKPIVHVNNITDRISP